MSKTLLVRGARQLLTLRGSDGPRRGADLLNLGLIQDGAVLISDGIIQEVGPSRRVENLAASRAAEVINANGRVVLPGFVDSHTHLVGGPPRLIDYEMWLAGATEQEVIEAGGGYPALFRAVREMSSRMLEAHARRVLRHCVRQGTTTIETKSGYGIKEAGEMKILRIHRSLCRGPATVVSTFMGARALPDEYEGRPDDYTEWLCSYLLPAIRRRKLAEFVDFVCDGSIFGCANVRRFFETAKQLGFGLKMHAGSCWNSSAVGLAVELGASSIYHADSLNGRDAALLSRSDTVAALLPGSAFYLGNERYVYARALIDRGVAVALATDYNPETCPSHNMQMMIALACRKMNMTPAEAISASTINGAYAVGRAHRTGSIETGKDADLVILSVPDYREIPYHFGVNLVETTIRKGRMIYRARDVPWPLD
jgi:imidazolonepropionase